MTVRRALVLTTSSNVGGMERVVCSLARCLPSSNWSVRLVFPDPPRSGDLLEWCQQQGVDARIDPALVDAASPHGVRTAWRLAGLVRHAKAEVVNLHYGDNFVSLWDVLAVRVARPRARLVTSIHHPTSWAETSDRKRLMTRIACRISHVVTVFSDATRKVVEEAPVARDSIVLIPCGIAAPLRSPDRSTARSSLGLPEAKPVIVTISRLVAHKRVEDLIRAVDTSSLDSPILVVVGDGPLRSRLEEVASACEKADVRLLGRVGNIDEVLVAADVFALASELEGFGLVYVEAAMHGIPSVGTRTGGTSDAVIHGETGLLVDVGDISGLRQAIEAVINDEQLRLRLGAAAKERAHAELSEVVMSERFAALFDRVSP